MLGKRSHPLLETSSKTSFPPVEDYYKKAVCRQTGKKHSLLPQHVTVGFEVPQDQYKPSEYTCESPRSVLDANVVPLEKNLCSWSFRSYVQALPFRKKEAQGVGLAIIVDIHAEEKRCNSFLPVVHGPALLCAHKDRSDQLNTISPSSGTLAPHHRHGRTQPIAIAANCHSQSRPSTESFDSDYLSSLVLNVVPDKIDCKADEDGDTARPCIFAVASIPSDHASHDIQSISFLETCVFCQRDFAPGEDIFMYRGDQAFCSTECRWERMKMDEYMEKSTRPICSFRSCTWGLSDFQCPELENAVFLT